MNKTLKWILIVLLILVMAFIFIMSAQNARKSTDESRGVGRMIGRILHRDFDEWDPSDQLAYVRKIDGTVRRFGHFTEFTLLGAVLHLVLTVWGVKEKIALPVSLGAGVLYSLTDEFHQLFVEGRSFEFSDILLDSAGVAIGALVVWIIVTAVARKREKKAGTASA